MTAGSIVVVLLMGASLFALPAVDPRPTPTPSGSTQGSVSVTIPLVSGVNDGGGNGGGGHGSGSGGSGTGGSGGDGGSGGTVCTVISPPTAPSPPASSTSNAPKLTIKPSHAAQGDRVSLRGEGFQALEKVEVVSYPGARVLGNLVVGSDGALDAKVRIPVRQPVGPTTIQVTGWLDCKVANGPLLVVSPSGSGFSMSPWVGWIVASSGIMLALICLFLAGQLGWLPVLRRRSPA